jgi:putative membrane protein
MNYGLLIAVTYLHYLSFMLCFAALAVEALTLKKELSLQDAWKIVIADAIYGISALGILVTGILRVLYFGKGREYYLNNPVFYIKVTVFLLVGLLSIYPTVSFLKWIKSLLQNQLPELELVKVKRLLWLIRFELVGFGLIPLLATIMARYS